MGTHTLKIHITDFFTLAKLDGPEKWCGLESGPGEIDFSASLYTVVIYLSGRTD